MAENETIETAEQAVKRRNAAIPESVVLVIRRMLDEGKTFKEIVEKTGVSQSTVSRIKNGQLTADCKPDTEPHHEPSPAQTFTVLESMADTLPPRDVAILRSLTEQVLRALAGVEGETDADSHNLGQAYGLLTAVQLILGGGA